jgi:hypothetical protein
MTLVPVSQTNLVRARREMEKFFEMGDWQAVRDWDQLLATQLNQAFDDPERDHRMLLGELSKILGLYSEMVRHLPQPTIAEWAHAESKN